MRPPEKYRSAFHSRPLLSTYELWEHRNRTGCTLPRFPGLSSIPLRRASLRCGEKSKRRKPSVPGEMSLKTLSSAMRVPPASFAISNPAKAGAPLIRTSNVRCVSAPTAGGEEHLGKVKVQLVDPLRQRDRVTKAAPPPGLIEGLIERAEYWAIGLAIWGAPFEIPVAK